MIYLDSHLEHAETGLDTLRSGVSAPLGPDRCILGSNGVKSNINEDEEESINSCQPQKTVEKGHGRWTMIPSQT